MRDIRSFDLNLLRALDALLVERSVTRAATRLGLTQPAVSGMLVRLREGFGDPLLIRAQRGMVPTSRALDLAPAVRRVLAGVEGLFQPATFDPVSADATLNVAASDYALSVVLEPLFVALRQRAPGFRTVVHALSRSSIAAQLETGALDIALTAAASDFDMHVHSLFRERFVCVLRDGHPAAAAPWSQEVFCSLDHVLTAFDGSLEGLTDHVLAESGLKRRVVLSAASFLVLPKLIRSTDVVAVMPARLVANQSGLILRPAPVGMPGFVLSAVWHERTHLDPARAWARSVLIEVCNRLGASDSTDSE